MATSRDYLAEDQGASALVTVAAANTLATVVVLARVVARWKLDGHFGLDDGLICNAQILNLTVMVAHFKVLEYGAGRHVRAVPRPALATMYEWLVAAQLTYAVGLYLCRVSALALYARLDPRPHYRRYLVAAMVVFTTVAFVQILVTGLQCVPLAALWGGADGVCIGSEALYLSTGLLAICSDAVVLGLPIVLVISAITSGHNRIALGALVAFALFTFTTPIIRIAALIPVIYKADITWYLPDALAWTTVEFSAAVIALSLPALKKLLLSPKVRPGHQPDPSRHLAWLDSQVEQHFPLNEQTTAPEMHEPAAHPDTRSSLGLWIGNDDAARDPREASSPDTAARRLAEERAHDAAWENDEYATPQTKPTTREFS